MNNKTIITKGESLTLEILIRDENNNPFDLTGSTVSIKAKIGTTLTTFVSPVVTVISNILGKLSFELQETETVLLKYNIFDFDVVIQKGDDVRIVRFRNQVEVGENIK